MTDFLIAPVVGYVSSSALAGGLEGKYQEHFMPSKYNLIGAALGAGSYLIATNLIGFQKSMVVGVVSGLVPVGIVFGFGAAVIGKLSGKSHL